ncbi:MAG: hypothetical protein VX278_02295, partial [Myxococcota bacterium]|nr:hypothetical protein [Myxococcota bacterium]
NSTGILYQFDFDGNLMSTFETGVEEGGLMGLYSVIADDIWYVDAAKNELWRIQSGTSEPFEMGDAGEY